MRSHRLAALLFVVALASAIPAMPTRAQSHSISYADDPGVVVVRYALVHGEIGESVRGPSLEIYGDGHVRVHRPAYMKQAGDRDLRISREEVSALVNELGAAGLLDLDTRALRSERLHAAQEEHVGITHANGIQEITGVRDISDPPVTVIEINVVRGQGAAARSVRKVIRWAGLQHDARRFKNIPRLQKLAEAEDRLAEVLQRAH